MCDDEKNSTQEERKFGEHSHNFFFLCSKFQNSLQLKERGETVKTSSSGRMSVEVVVVYDDEKSSSTHKRSDSLLSMISINFFSFVFQLKVRSEGETVKRAALSSGRLSVEEVVVDFFVRRI